MHVYVVGLECQPQRGSEPAIAWHWASAYESLGHSVTIVTHDSQREYTAGRGRRVLFVGSRTTGWVPQPAATSRGLLRTSVEVVAWTRNVHRVLQAQVEPEDLVHHVSWGTVRVQSPVAGLPCRTVWGPVGGGHLSPWAWALNSSTGSVFEAVRNASVLAVRVASRWRQTAEGIGTVLATNTETASLASAAGAAGVGLELADGLTCLYSTDSRSSIGDEIRLFWAGRVVRSKRLDLAVEVVAALRARGRAAQLTVAGDGPDLARIRQLVVDLDLQEQVNLLGWTQHSEMPPLYANADLYVFTSFRDSSYPAVLEAAAHGLPSVAVDHQGVRALLPDTAALKVNPTPLTSMAARMADAVLELSGDEARYERIAAGARAAAAEQLWPAKARRVLAALGLDTAGGDAPELAVGLPVQRLVGRKARVPAP